MTQFQHISRNAVKVITILRIFHKLDVGAGLLVVVAAVTAGYGMRQRSSCRRVQTLALRRGEASDSLFFHALKQSAYVFQ